MSTIIEKNSGTILVVEKPRVFSRYSQEHGCSLEVMDSDKPITIGVTRL